MNPAIGEFMRKIYGWFINFIGYVFALLGITLLVVYLQNLCVSIFVENPYLIWTLICALILNMIGTYVVHRGTE
jgi:hypothetical protein